MDLKKAKEEMSKSKYYPNIPPIELVLPSGLENRRKMALRLQENLSSIGVKLNINQELWGRMTDMATTAETTPNIMVTSVSANYPDPDTYLYCMYHSKAAGTWMSSEWLQNPQVDRLIEKERSLISVPIYTSMSCLCVRRCRITWKDLHPDRS
jgi:peptide/nickel transport system substrate-binding protein